MKETEKFLKYYQEEKEKIDDALEEFNKEFEKDENPWLEENKVFFKELNQGGKNIRGTLVSLGYYLAKNNQEYSIPLALAYEVFQTSILVHDDVIDQDKTRRNKRTIHYQNELKYRKYPKEEVEHFGNSVALCMGDYGLYSANQIIVKNYKKDPNLGAVLECFHNAVLDTIRGELLDVILPFQKKYKKVKDLEKTIFDIYRLKTALYTIVGPLSVGLILAGAKEKDLAEIKEFGENVGVAFQIQDDILGIYSDKIGKVIGSDIKEYKQTILYAHACRTSYQKELEKYYGKGKITKRKVQKVRDIMVKSGSKDYALEEMNRYYDKSLEVLDHITWIANEKKDLLKGFVEYLRKREF